MFLKKIYSEPKGLFETVKFNNGINFIYGKKTNSNDPKKSLNGIGKSTFIDLIDFCLMGSFHHNSRLRLAKDIMSDYKIVLEFEIDDEKYKIKRGVDKPNEIEFFKNEKLTTYTRKDFQDELCNIIFYRKEYAGYFSDKWLRKLIPFFVKVQKPKKEKFIDPISYIKELSISEQNQYHLFLMNIDNKLAYKNFNIQSEIKKKTPAIKEVKKFIEETYGLKNITEAINEINKTKTELIVLEDAVKSFKLKKVYTDVEKETNEITKKIKELFYENYSDKKKITSFEESFLLDANINSSKIKAIYKELNESLAQEIKKTLDSAIKFRKELSKSRKEFITKEIELNESNIKQREKEIGGLEKKRAELFNFLATKDAISDLTEAFNSINKKKNIISDIESRTKIYEDLRQERADLKIEESNLEKEMLTFLSDTKEKIFIFSNIFYEIYNAIYPESKNKSLFGLSESLKKDSKIEIEISFPAMLSKGKNQGRTLIYDLSILFHSIKKDIRIPKFLIHDGIFDGMDRAHFIALYNFLKNKEEMGDKFQYIVTLNEEGTLSENFGDINSKISKEIENEAIITLTPSQKLFDKDF